MPETTDARPQAKKPVTLALQDKFEQAMVLHRQGNLADAESIYQEVLQRQPNHFDALHLLGVISLQTERTELAVDFIRKAIRLNGSVAIAHNNLGKALLDLNRHDAALTSFDRAIALEPGFAMAHNNRGRALLKLKRPEEARASFDIAIGLKQEFPEAWDNLACAFIVLCCWEEAEQASRKAVALKSDYSDAWMHLGYALNELERWDEAVVASRKALTLKPDHIVAWSELGYALVTLRRWNEAEKACRSAITFGPDHADAWFTLSRALAAQNRQIEAKEAERRFIALAPNRSEPSDLKEANLRKLHETINRLIGDARTNNAIFDPKLAHIRELHQIAMQGLQSNPGEYRKRSMAIASSPHVPPNWANVPALMDDMCRYVNTNWTLQDSIHLAAFVLWRLNSIHPFDDGNGRIARALCHAILSIKSTTSPPAAQSFDEAVVKKPMVYADYISCLDHAHDTYSQTRNIDKSARHVEQWLEPFAREHLKT